jgi:hypothetical protein
MEQNEGVVLRQAQRPEVAARDSEADQGRALLPEGEADGRRDNMSAVFLMVAGAFAVGVGVGVLVTIQAFERYFKKQTERNKP